MGINDRKLKQGFREVFGTTVFCYLRDRRLEQAQELLLSGQMQVKDAAKAVGYASPTSFIPILLKVTTHDLRRDAIYRVSTV